MAEELAISAEAIIKLIAVRVKYEVLKYEVENKTFKKENTTLRSQRDKLRGCLSYLYERYSSKWAASDSGTCYQVLRETEGD